MTELLETGVGARDASRVGDWICTASGQKFWPLDPRVEDFNDYDIAHSLALRCRFGGHTREFYSVAQHATLVLDIVENALDTKHWFENDDATWRWHALTWALHHDDAEAYLCDVPRPLKIQDAMSAYREVEYRVERAICSWLGISWPVVSAVRDVVHWADNVALYWEALSFMPAASVRTWNWPAEVINVVPRMIVARNWRDAEGAYRNAVMRIRKLKV